MSLISGNKACTDLTKQHRKTSISAVLHWHLGPYEIAPHNVNVHPRLRTAIGEKLLHKLQHTHVSF